MEKSKKIIIFSMMIVILIIIILILLLILNSKKEDIIDSSEETATYEDGADTIKISENIENVTSATMYYTVQSCIQKYLTFLGVDINEERENSQSLAKSLEINNDKEKRTAIYDLLSNTFIEDNKIDVDNIYDFVENTKQKMLFETKDIAMRDFGQIQKYSVYGKVTVTDDEYYTYFRVTLDTMNDTFMIEPIDNSKYNSVNELVLENNCQSINKNSRNSFFYNRVDNLQLAKNYLSNYIQNALNNTEESFYLLDEEYRTKRFNNLKQYKKYIQSNKEEIQKISLKEYLVNKYEDYTEFICKDQFGNIYIFDTTAIMKYTLKLDTYTIISDNFKESYDSGDEKNKVLMNIDKWVKMLNNRDYSAAYNVLDETFRNNNFGSEEKFEQYMRENYPIHYSVTFSDYNEETDVSIVSMSLRDITGENNMQKDLKIIMQLKENYDFVISFEI